MQICPDCGNQVADNVRFCTRCGHNMTQTQQPVYQPPQQPQYQPQYQPQQPVYQPQQPVYQPQQPQYQPVQSQTVYVETRKGKVKANRGVAVVIIILAFILVAAIMIPAIAFPNKTYELDGIALELPRGMEDISDERKWDEYEFALDSRTIFAGGLEDTFQELEDLGVSDPENMTLEEYTQLALEANDQPANAAVESDDFYWFTTESTREGKRVVELFAVFKGSDSFWIVHLVGIDKEVAELHQIAKTVEID